MNGQESGKNHHYIITEGLGSKCD